MSLVYAGQFLRIDLSTETVTSHEIDDADVRAFLLLSLIHISEPTRPY